jgi:hypothetical protein
MKKRILILALSFALLSACMAFLPAQALAGSESYVAQAVVAQAPAAPAKIEADKRITITLFCILIAVTLYIVYWAAKRTTSSGDYPKQERLQLFFSSLSFSKAVLYLPL